MQNARCKHLEGQDLDKTQSTSVKAFSFYLRFVLRLECTGFRNPWITIISDGASEWIFRVVWSSYRWKYKLLKCCPHHHIGTIIEPEQKNYFQKWRSVTGEERLWEVTCRLRAGVLWWVWSGSCANACCSCVLQRSQASLVKLPDPLSPCLFDQQTFAARAAAVPSWSFPCCAGANQDNCQWGHNAKQITEEGTNHFFKNLCWFWVFWELLHSRGTKPLEGHSWKNSKLHKDSKGWEERLKTVLLPKKISIWWHHLDIIDLF